jgi:iron(III) transport system substrate-binding protein
MMKRALLAAAALTASAPAWAQDDRVAPPALVEAARKEGSMTLYTSNLTENELDLLKHFNRRHPFLKVGIVRAPGGQLVTRIKSEAAAGKLTADMVTLSDRGLAATIADLFADYAPPNAADYPPETVTLGKLWPRTVVVWTIAYNDALVKNPPKSWKDLTDPAHRGQTGEVVILSGGSTWGRSMYQRKTFGDDYWPAVAAQKPSLFPSGAPASDALSRGEIAVLPVLLNQIMPKGLSGAPVKWVFPSDGVPIIPQVDGIPKTAASPNAAKLFLNWALSPEGQTILVKEQGFLSVLNTVPRPEGLDARTRTWVPDEGETERLRAGWTEDWNRTFNYRQ